MARPRSSTPLFVSLADKGVAGRVIGVAKNTFGQETYIVEEKGHVRRLHALIPEIDMYHVLTAQEYGQRTIRDYGQPCTRCGHYEDED